MSGDQTLLTLSKASDFLFEHLDVVKYDGTRVNLDAFRNKKNDF